jgi:hypothetical protein
MSRLESVRRIATDANDENCFWLGSCAGLGHRVVRGANARKCRVKMKIFRQTSG